MKNERVMMTIVTNNRCGLDYIQRNPQKEEFPLTFCTSRCIFHTGCNSKSGLVSGSVVSLVRRSHVNLKAAWLPQIQMCLKC